MFTAALSTVARDWEGNVRILQEGTGWTHYSALTGCARSSERERVSPTEPECRDRHEMF